MKQDTEEEKLIEEIRRVYAKTYPNIIYAMANEIERLKKLCGEYIEGDE